MVVPNKEDIREVGGTAVGCPEGYVESDMNEMEIFKGASGSAVVNSQFNIVAVHAKVQVAYNSEYPNGRFTTLSTLIDALIELIEAEAALQR